MRFEPLALEGAFRIEIEPREDERGFFARTFCRREFEAHGLPTDWPQANLSRNTRKATLRGMHFQNAPYAEPKVVRCARGAIFDVLVDLRPDSATHGCWVGETLTADNALSLYVPVGFAHGFQTLTDETDVLYLMGAEYVPGHAEGVRWNDPAFGIDWPHSEPLLSERDATYADWRP